MTPKEKARSALTAVFPKKESVADFIKDSEGRDRLQSFMEFASRHALIDSPTREAFEAFIDANSRPSISERRDELMMEDFVNNRREYLNIRISNRVLLDKINGLLLANKISLPPLSSSMFTRLKRQTANTPRKRDALRSFAFWIGYERAEEGKQWHYETLKDLCREDPDTPLASSRGIRIAFSINSRGNIIGREIITWMKRTIRNTLSARADQFPGKNPPKIKNYDLATFQVDLSNSDQSAVPAAYADTLKEAITIAHQAAIQWMMSGMASDNLFFSIGIAAGDFDKINNQLQAILKSKLPEDPVIRLTDFARQCVVINQIKIIISHNPKEMELHSGEVFKVWWITELSGMIYWDLVPELIRPSFLEKGVFNSMDLRRRLIISGKADFSQDNDAISYFIKFPHYPMLGFEIVRTLICENKISESVEILNALLRVTPHHLNSHIMRMVLYKYLGLEASNYYLSNMMFSRAEKEAAYIIENFNHFGEEFYVEYALLKLARLSTAVMALRRHGGTVLETMNLRLSTSDLIEMILQAEEIIDQGIIVSSPTVDRILFLFLSVQMMKFVLFENIKADGLINSRLTCPNEKIKAHMFGVIISHYQHVLAPGSPDLTTAMQFIGDMIIRYDKLIALEAFRPSNFFLIALFYWDILPLRNVAVIKETLRLLKEAVRSARMHARGNRPVYSMANLAGQFVSSNQFISQINSIIKAIEKRYQTASELERLDPAAVIGPADDDMVMTTFHL